LKALELNLLSGWNMFLFGLFSTAFMGLVFLPQTGSSVSTALIVQFKTFTWILEKAAVIPNYLQMLNEPLLSVLHCKE